MFKTLATKLDHTIREVNSPNWSLTKLGMLFFLYPSITGVFIFDAVVNHRMEWMNTAVFITGIVTPRLISQIVAARFGYQGKTPSEPSETDSGREQPVSPDEEQEEEEDTSAKKKRR